ncbi:GGDEF domain [actinobacterium SCGC AAA044-D11]
MARVGVFLLLISHLIIRVAFQLPSIVPDLIIFNLIAFLAAYVAWKSPRLNDRLARLAITFAIFLWALGSTFSTSNSFYDYQVSEKLVDVTYIAFYPLMILGIIRALAVTKKVTALELLDTAIIALGTSSVISSLLLRPAQMRFDGQSYEVFLSILYPVGDLVLVATCLSLIILQHRSMRGLSLFLGILIFALTDLFFLLLSATTGYEFAALTDDGWLLGLVLIANALYLHGGETEIPHLHINTWATTFALIFSSSILAYGAFRANYFPTFVLILSFLTISLAFLRMALALRDAKLVSEDREHARTDELTGLPNRRRFIAELELLRRRTGTLLLLDLDGFKAINDNYGHEVGDQLLKQITLRFNRVLPNDVLIARLGGDEFGVIVYGKRNIGSDVALALRATCTYPFTLSVGDVKVGVSIGSVTTEGPTTTKEALLKRADAAMYEAKRNGTGYVQSLN